LLFYYIGYVIPLIVNMNTVDFYGSLYRMFFSKLDAFTALRFKGTGAPLAAKGMGILPMIQHVDNIWNKGKFFPLFTDNRIC
jgi:hypothetical protein